MELQTFQYSSTEGWSIKTLPELDSKDTLVLVFASPEFNDQSAPLMQLAKQYPQSKMIGCSTAGEISGPTISDHSIVVAVVRFQHTALALAKYKIQSVEDSFVAGQDIAAQLHKDTLRGIFVLSEGLQINGSELVKGLNEGVQDLQDVVVTGGLAGDGVLFKKTWTLCNGEINTNMILAIGFYGDYIQIGHASRGGWEIFGPERRITRSKSNVLYEIDEKPALDLYKKYLGEKASDLPASGLLFPLSIRKDFDDDKRLVRTILAIDEAAQSLTFAGDIPLGYLAQLMHASFDRLVISAGEAGAAASKSIIDINKDLRPILSVAISCVGRRLLMGERTVEETESVIESLPAHASQIGFYSYGEISPYEDGSCDLHNQTMTLSLFYESETKKGFL